jgi:protein farnesyltransferase/geranylgeranyltransferase type-1 subunit alpha
MSPRVLELTEDIIRLNPAHYSAWCVTSSRILMAACSFQHRQYRYKTLLAIDADLEKELELMDELAVKYLKTYQVWHHRRLLLANLKKPAPELKFIETGLRADEKNYHTWSYRQWILAHFNEEDLWSGELPFIENLLEKDVRNNSAWHHRFFVVFQSGVHKGDEDREVILNRELS